MIFKRALLARARVHGGWMLLMFAVAPAWADSDPTSQGDRAAEQIRAAFQVDDIAERNRLADAAIATLEALIEDPASSDQTVRRSRFDRVVALRVRERMPQALAAYEQLLADGLEPPAYVTQAAADAALYERRPERAAELYREVLAGEPGQHNAQLALFYAEMEQEAFDRALSTIDALRDDTERGSRSWVEASSTAAMARAYANRLESAQQRLEALQREHPDNHRVGQDLATVYRWRGWPNLALETLQPYLRAAPERTDLRLLQAALYSDLGRFELAGNALETLYSDHPENRHVQRDVATWEKRDRWSMQMDAEYAETDNDSPFGSRERGVGFQLNAPWIGHYTQPYLRHRYSDATFPEGEGEYDRIGAGMLYRRGGHRLKLELNRNRTGNADTGVDAGYDVRLGDHWSLAAGYESFSIDVPLRGHRQGLDGWKAEASARWQAHESFGWRLGASRLAISDGNVRWSALTTIHHRLHASAHHITDGGLDLYASRASQSGGPYYNPDRDASLSWQVKHDWMTWREYEQSFTQRFRAGAGAYWQEGFGTHATALFRYEHLWQLSHHWRIHYGVGVASRVYDGNREERFDGQLKLEGVF